MPDPAVPDPAAPEIAADAAVAAGEAVVGRVVEGGAIAGGVGAGEAAVGGAVAGETAVGGTVVDAVAAGSVVTGGTVMDAAILSGAGAAGAITGGAVMEAAFADGPDADIVVTDAVVIDAAVADAAVADAMAAGTLAAALARPEDTTLAPSALIQLPHPAPHAPDASLLPSGTPRGTLRGIVFAPDPLLRAICAPAGELTFAELRSLTADLFETMYAAGGRGLAAPQIGVSRRVFVMDEGWKRGAPQPLVVIDPGLRWRSRKTARAVEECLSIPGQPVEMRRAASIRLTFFDLTGVEVDLTMDGTAARIAQHELDHLNGVLIGDAPAARKPPPRKRAAKPAATKPAPANPPRRRPRA